MPMASLRRQAFARCRMRLNLNVFTLLSPAVSAEEFSWARTARKQSAAARQAVDGGRGGKRRRDMKALKKLVYGPSKTAAPSAPAAPAQSSTLPGVVRPVRPGAQPPAAAVAGATPALQPQAQAKPAAPKPAAPGNKQSPVPSQGGMTSRKAALAQRMSMGEAPASRPAPAAAAPNAGPSVTKAAPASASAVSKMQTSSDNGAGQSLLQLLSPPAASDAEQAELAAWLKKVEAWTEAQGAAGAGSEADMGLLASLEAQLSALQSGSLGGLDVATLEAELADAGQLLQQAQAAPAAAAAVEEQQAGDMRSMATDFGRLPAAVQKGVAALAASDASLAKVLSGQFLREFEATEQAARAALPPGALEEAGGAEDADTAELEALVGRMQAALEGGAQGDGDQDPSALVSHAAAVLEAMGGDAEEVEGEWEEVDDEDGIVEDDPDEAALRAELQAMLGLGDDEQDMEFEAGEGGELGGLDDTADALAVLQAELEADPSLSSADRQEALAAAEALLATPPGQLPSVSAAAAAPSRARRGGAAKGSRRSAAAGDADDDDAPTARRMSTTGMAAAVAAASGVSSKGDGNEDAPPPVLPRPVRRPKQGEA